MRFLALLTLCTVFSNVYSDVFSCGGFVRSTVPSILQKVKVQFLSDEGHLKYETACNPTNGYYMIPVYTRGIYKIKVSGPDGFIFDPSERVVNINDGDNECSSGKDINFELAAFKVSGKILSGQSEGPGILELGLYTVQGRHVATTTTNNDGVYSFDASPGKYVVSTLEKTSQCVDRGSVPVEVVDKPVFISTDLKISGQNLVVKVVSESSEPVEDAEVTLASQFSIPFEKQLNAEVPVSAILDKDFIYTLKTPKGGNVVFSCLPPGTFRLNVQWVSGKTSMTFEPKEKVISINVKKEHIIFKSTGFKTTGVVGYGGRPLSDVEVLLKKKGEEFRSTGKTAKDGSFTLVGLTKGSYVVTAQKEKLQFNENTFELTAEGGQVGRIELLKVQLCGQVVFDNTNVISGKAFNIGLYSYSGDKVSSIKIESPQGRFCTFVLPGKFNLKPEFSSPVVHPDSLAVVVETTPIESVIFTEFKARVVGSVMCIDGCSGIQIDLQRNDEVVNSQNVVDNRFSFDDVSPGEYQLVVVENDGKCWENVRYSIRVLSANVEDIVIRQTGFKIPVHSTKSAKLNWEGVGSHGVVDVNPGTTEFCIPKKGIYNMVIKSCYEFDCGMRFSKELPQDEIVLKVRASKVGLNVKSEANINANDVTIVVKSPSGTVVVSPLKSEKNNILFEFNLKQDESGASIELIPTSSAFLFKPHSYSFTFDGSCNLNLLTFTAFHGKYIEGSVEPPLKDVEVSALHKQSSEVLTGKTDSSGRFKIGLVFNPYEYGVSLVSEGYKFSELGSNKFKATKLSKLVIYYFDGQTQQPLDEVLVSVSGGVDYRSNVVVDKSGRRSFVGLPAGDYFVTSVLREYQFVPDQTSVSIKEGETIERKIYGKRYAYSTFGKVLAAGGLPLNQVVVQALAENCGNLLEEDVTDNDGQFRVRGLKPGCEYKLVAKSRNGQKVRAIPPFIKHKAQQEDLRNVEFTLMVAAPDNQLLGLVHFHGLQRPKNLFVDLFEGDSKIASDELGPSNNLFVFNNRLLEGREYKVKINEKSLRSINAISLPVSFHTAQNGDVHMIKQITLDVKTLPRKTEVETSNSNIIGIFFVIFVTVVCMNLNNSKDVVLGLYESAIDVIRRDSVTMEKRKKPRNN